MQLLTFLCDWSFYFVTYGLFRKFNVVRKIKLVKKGGLRGYLETNSNFFVASAMCVTLILKAVAL